MVFEIRSQILFVFFVLMTCSAYIQNAYAGNGANFVLYDHRTGEKGETEIKIYNDVGKLQDDSNFTAQLLELEYAVTDKWMTAAYLEAHSQTDQNWSFDGFRLETRYRLFDYGTPLNPVLYLEYVNLKESALYVREVVGRTDEEEEVGEGEEDPNKRENELESKLILGEDILDKLRLGFNWINDVDLKSGKWEFGYAAGLTYTIFEKEKKAHIFDIKEMQLGLEFYGGLGDSSKGLTVDGSVTEQYAGLNLKTEFSNGTMFMVGGAFGLTEVSRDPYLRAMLGIEFD